MKAQDGGPRPDPFELGFPGPAFVEERFGQIAEEAEARGSDPADPGAFLLLGQVGRTLRELGGGEGGAEELRTLGAFLFHAFHFDRAGRPGFRMETAAARYLVETNPISEGWDGAPPSPAGYLQLPRNLFWTRPDPSGAAEPLDGLFWASGPGPSLSLLAVTGIRPDRPGFSVVPVPPAPLSDAPRWVRDPARPSGEDFETTLPGGELDRLYSIETGGELLKLVARTFGYLHTVPGAVTELPDDPVDRTAETPRKGSIRSIRLGR